MYIGLWSRLEGFERDQLTRALERKSVVQGTMMRDDDPPRLEGATTGPSSSGSGERRREQWVRAHKADKRERSRPRAASSRPHFDGDDADASAEVDEILSADSARDRRRALPRPRAGAAVGNVGAASCRHLRARRGLGRAGERDELRKGSSTSFGATSRASARHVPTRSPTGPGVSNAGRPKGARRARAPAFPRTSRARSSSTSRALPLPDADTPAPVRLPPGVGRDAPRPRAAHSDPPGEVPLTRLQREDPPLGERVPRRRPGRGYVEATRRAR